MALVIIKNSPANAGDLRDKCSIPGWEKSAGGGHGDPLHYSCLENPSDSGAQGAVIHGVTKGQTQLK